MSKGRKYSSVHSATDVWEALAHLGHEARAHLRLSVRESITTPSVVIVSVDYCELTPTQPSAPCFTWQETLAKSRKADLASYLHRVIWDSYEAYLQAPWYWTARMRKEHARP